MENPISRSVVSAASAQAGPRDSLPRVTLIGDSVADAFTYDASARAILGAGVDLNLQVAPCRRVGQDSCPYNGARPPNVLDLVKSLGPSLGDVLRLAPQATSQTDDEQLLHQTSGALGSSPLIRARVQPCLIACPEPFWRRSRSCSSRQPR